ncbi:MAG: DUF2179 domain-containing protein [Mollicutes bacterium]|nr:DUF2179 domain-containing protein [Mollicutes bacterium]
MLLLALKIFFVRILDVSLGTIRMILIVKDRKIIASIVGFIEIAIWFAVVKEAINTDSSSMIIVASYAGGFAVGTLVGAYLSEKFIKGSLNVQVISNKNKRLAKFLRKNGFAVSVVNVQGIDDKNPKEMLIIEVDKKEFKNLQELIKKGDSKAFIIVNETKYVQNGYFRNVIK